MNKIAIIGFGAAAIGFIEKIKDQEQSSLAISEIELDSRKKETTLSEDEKSNLSRNSKLFEKCAALQEYPHRGHIPSELSLLGIDDFLELTYKPYRIIYQIIEKEVFIYCILDGRRDMQKLLQERLMRE